VVRKLTFATLVKLATVLPVAAAAQDDGPGHFAPAAMTEKGQPSNRDTRLADFAPTTDPIRHRIDYEIFDFALENIVVLMGPSNRHAPYLPIQPTGTRLKQGPQSRYRLEGSMVGFSFFDRKVIESFTLYREELQAIGDTIPIHTLPRNEQLAYWYNLHNVALLEQLSQQWPLREPREIMLDGVPLDEARFITVQGISLSLRDIREKIVFAHWRDPKVIYGFWRGEIGGPALQTMAFTGQNVGSLLDLAANEFVNALRGTEKRGDTLHVAELYAEVAPFYFPDFARDLRTHLANYADEEVSAILAKTSATEATIREYDIADLAGGSRGANYLAGSTTAGRPGIPPGVLDLLRQRQRKLEVLARREVVTTRVFFSNIDLPGDPPNKSAVE
jgi:Protein of unknown function, DUF547